MHYAYKQQAYGNFNILIDTKIKIKINLLKLNTDFAKKILYFDYNL